MCGLPNQTLQRTGSFHRNIGTLLECESNGRFDPGRRAPPAAERLIR